MTNPYPSIDLIAAAMQDRGYTSTAVNIAGRKHVVFRKDRAVWITPRNFVHYPFVSNTVTLLAKHKEMAYKFMSELGHAVPATQALQRGEAFVLDEALRDKILVVKPSDGAGSHGVTIGVIDEMQIGVALEKAFEHSSRVLLQELFVGEEIRLTVLNGEVLSALLRQNAQVIGDGVSSVKKLIEVENIERSQLDFPYTIYPQLETRMITEPVDMNYVPANGEAVIFNRGAVIAGGASRYNIVDSIHPSYKAIAQDVSKALGAPFLVVDFLARDYTVQATNDNHIFLELNTSPSLELYYTFRNGENVDIVTKLADTIDDYLRA